MHTEILQKMSQLRLIGMQRAFESLLQTTSHTTADEMIQLLIQAEWEERHNKKLLQLTRTARFCYLASVEEIQFPAKRNLEKNTFIRLADCGYIDRKENILMRIICMLMVLHLLRLLLVL